MKLEKEYCFKCKEWVPYNERNDAMEPGDEFIVRICPECGGDTVVDGPRCIECHVALMDDDSDFCDEHDPFSMENISRVARGR